MQTNIYVAFIYMLTHNTHWYKKKIWEKRKTERKTKVMPTKTKQKAWGPVYHSNVCNQQHSVTCEQEINEASFPVLGAQFRIIKEDVYELKIRL